MCDGALINVPDLQSSIIDVSGWVMDDEYEVYPVGSRPKKLMICPEGCAYSLLRPGHHYLFKSSSHNYPMQYWAEIIAYRIGLRCGVKVPPAYAAYDSRTGERGALIEWFYDMPPNKASHRFIHGVNYLKGLIPDFDYKTGRQHNIKIVLLILNMIRHNAKLQNPVVFWARTFAFDCLIGNTDRHQENWGILWPIDDGRPRFAPAFDNGTSLGHEQTEANLAKFAQADRLKRYVHAGRHHMRWEPGGDRIGHFEMMDRFLTKFPSAQRVVRGVAKCPIDIVAGEVANVQALGEDAGLSLDRSRFVLDLLEYRHHLLQEFA